MRPEVIVQGQYVIPRWWRTWNPSVVGVIPDGAPELGEIAFLDSYIWVDLTMEEFLTHNQVKAAYDYAIMSVVNPASLGVTCRIGCC